MKIYSQGDQAIVVSIEKKVSKDLTEDLLALKSYLLERNFPFITEIVPTESDMMICYDARSMIKHHHIQSPFQYMKDLVYSIRLEIVHDDTPEGITNIPVIYGGEYGPDLEQLLQYYDIDLERQIHMEIGSLLVIRQKLYSILRKTILLSLHLAIM
jgi:inhibitor of KinA